MFPWLIWKVVIFLAGEKEVFLLGVWEKEYLPDYLDKGYFSGRFGKWLFN